MNPPSKRSINHPLFADSRRRFIKQQGLPLDQNVYEGAFWSAVTPLTRKSVAEDGMPQDLPDFTRGQWKDTAPLGIIS